MARRRMFNLDIIDTDLFIEMPQSSRLLYYELCMRADDDGFVSSPKKIQRVVGCSDDDFKVLITKKFIIPFETGIVVIRHWKIHNYIQKDRYKETLYSEEKRLLLQGENGAYDLMDTPCIQIGDTGKDSIELDKNIKKEIYKERKYYDDSNLNNIFIEFLELRKKLKAVNSDRAINTLINSLSEYDDGTKYKMIETSIVNSWKSIYPLKENKKVPEWINKKQQIEKMNDDELKELEEEFKQFKGE